jgi:hypothetical protein
MLERFLPSSFGAGENMDPRILEPEPDYNNGSNKVFLLFKKIYWLLHLKFLQPFFPSGREKSESLFSRERIVGGEWRGSKSPSRNLRGQIL